MKSIAVLLSDSQLLFRKNSTHEYYLSCLHRLSEKPLRRAVYIGASNGDVPEYYSLFETGMENLGIMECKHLKFEEGKDFQEEIDQADVILLAGGNPELGYKRMLTSGIWKQLQNRILKQGIIIGISAGAVQLGKRIMSDNHSHDGVQGLNMFNYIIGAHEEQDQWSNLKENVGKVPNAKGIGIPFGTGLVLHKGSLKIVGDKIPVLITKNESGVLDLKQLQS